MTNFENNLEEKEKKASVIEDNQEYEEKMAKELKHTTKIKTSAQKRIDDEPFSLHKS